MSIRSRYVKIILIFSLALSLALFACSSDAVSDDSREWSTTLQTYPLRYRLSNDQKKIEEHLYFGDVELGILRENLDDAVKESQWYSGDFTNEDLDGSFVQGTLYTDQKDLVLPICSFDRNNELYRIAVEFYFDVTNPTLDEFIVLRDKMFRDFCLSEEITMSEVASADIPGELVYMKEYYIDAGYSEEETLCYTYVDEDAGIRYCFVSEYYSGPDNDGNISKISYLKEYCR